MTRARSETRHRRRRTWTLAITAASIAVVGGAALVVPADATPGEQQDDGNGVQSFVEPPRQEQGQPTQGVQPESIQPPQQSQDP